MVGASNRSGELPCTSYTGKDICNRRWDQEKRYSLAASLFELAANQGNLEAQIRIAQYYKDGVGVSKSSEEAIKWLETTSKQGSKEAIYKLALMYDYGDGVARDAAKATQLYKDYYLDS